MKTLLIALGLALLTVLAFSPVRHFDFVTFDDPIYVLNNPAIARGLTWDGVVWAFKSSYAANWHPLTWISHMADVQWFGFDAGGHHLTSLAIHVINVVLLFVVLRRLTGSTGCSAFVAAVFAVHPLHVESVAWIAERKDVLSGLFFLLTLWAYSDYAQHPRWSRYLPVLLFFALGLMSKPMLVTLPFVLLLLDWWPLQRGRPFGRLILEKLPLFALAAASSVVTFVAQRAAGATNAQDVYPFATRAANALHAYATYVRDTFWPVDLAVFYPLRTSTPVVETIALTLVFLAISGAAVWLMRRARHVFVGWFWFAEMLVPVIGLVQVGSQGRADRYMYLPLIGLLIVVAWSVMRLVERRPALTRIVQAAASVAVLALAVTTHTQVQTWQNGLTLWQHAVDVAPDNARAHAALAVLLDEQRHDAGAAMGHLTEAVRLQPDLVEARRNLGLMLVRDGRVREAIPQFSEVVRLRPNSAEAHSDLGRALTETGALDEAISQLTEAVRLDASRSETYNNLGAAYAAAGRLPDATEAFLAAVRLAPGSEQAHFNLALALAKTGRMSDASREFAEVLRINPRNAQARAALASLSRGGGF